MSNHDKIKNVDVGPQAQLPPPYAENIYTFCNHGLKLDRAHIVPGGTDKSNGGDYENRLQYVKFGGLAILKP